MASILVNISRNRHGTIIRGVRVLHSHYDKQKKRDKLVYLGTIAQGAVDVPAKISQCLSKEECESLRAQLFVVAKDYWCERADNLETQLKEVYKAQMSLSEQQGSVPTDVARRVIDGGS